MRYALITFITVPLVEMIILIEVGSLIGAVATVGLVVLTATIGLWLLKFEGLTTLARFQEKLAQGQLPETELLEGIMLLVGGALLLTPGFITDALGFTCLLPGLRRPIAAWIIQRGLLNAGNLSGSSFQTRQSSPSGGTTIDGEFKEEDE